MTRSTVRCVLAPGSRDRPRRPDGPDRVRRGSSSSATKATTPPAAVATSAATTSPVTAGAAAASSGAAPSSAAAIDNPSGDATTEAAPASSAAGSTPTVTAPLLQHGSDTCTTPKGSKIQEVIAEPDIVTPDTIAVGWSVTAAPSGFVLHAADFVYGGDAAARGTLDSATATEGQRVAPGQTLKFDIRYGGVSQAPVIGSYAPGGVVQTSWE